MSTAHSQDSPFPGSVVVDGVVCYSRDEDPGVWLYVPSAPVAEVAGGKPAVQLWVSPASGILQLGAEWTVPADVLARLEAEAKNAAGGPVRLQPAPAVVRQVSLEIADDRGTPSVVAVSASSGFPPYRAIFRAELNAAATTAAVAALNGRSGRVAVRYQVAVPLKASVRVRVEGDVAAASTALPAGAAAAAVREWVNQAIADRRVVVTEAASGPADDNLAGRARELALREFVRLLAAGLGQSGAPAGDKVVTLKAVSTASDVVQRDVERAGDVSTWFRSGEGAGHVTVVSGPGGGEPVGPAEQGTTVALGFAASDLPVAFVEVRCRDRKVLLKAPRLEPATLDASGCADGLTVTTHFTTGGGPFRRIVPIAEAGRMPPSALGLTEFVVDGRERQAAGAREVRVRLQLRASRPPLSEDRTFYLRGDAWIGSFVVVDRGEPIEGECELDWKETTRDGQVRRHRSQVASHQSVFVLRETEPDPGVSP